MSGKRDPTPSNSHYSVTLVGCPTVNRDLPQYIPISPRKQASVSQCSKAAEISQLAEISSEVYKQNM